jgi:hypothetical protein
MTGPARNFSGVQFESVRARIDPMFNELHDSLEEAFYGDRDKNGVFIAGTGWRDGASKPWFGFDVQPTPEQSKQLFDELHGTIWHLHAIVFDGENAKEAEPIPPESYDTERDGSGAVIGSRIQDAKDALAAAGANRPALLTKLKSWAQEKGFALSLGV